MYWGRHFCGMECSNAVGHTTPPESKNDPHGMSYKHGIPLEFFKRPNKFSRIICL